MNKKTVKLTEELIVKQKYRAFVRWIHVIQAGAQHTQNKKKHQHANEELNEKLPVPKIKNEPSHSHTPNKHLAQKQTIYAMLNEKRNFCFYQKMQHVIGCSEATQTRNKTTAAQRKHK